MKKYLLVSVIATSLLFIGACSSEDSNMDVKKKTEIEDVYSKLNSDLDLYSQSYLALHAVSGTRSWWHRRGKAIVCGDCCGAVAGGKYGGFIGMLLGAVVGSATVAYLLERQSYTATEKCESFTVQAYAFCPQYEGLDSIGYLHNEILSEIEMENPAIFEKTTSYDELLTAISNKMEERNLLLSSEQKIEVQNEISAIVPNENVLLDNETFISHVSSVRPQYAQQCEVIERYVTTAEVLPEENIKEYTEGYVRVVERSDLSIEEQQVLISSVVVGGNSTLLWEKVSDDTTDALK